MNSVVVVCRATVESAVANVSPLRLLSMVTHRALEKNSAGTENTVLGGRPARRGRHPGILPPTCSPETRIKRFRAWLAERGVRYGG